MEGAENWVDFPSNLNFLDESGGKTGSGVRTGVGDGRSVQSKVRKDPRRKEAWRAGLKP